MMRLGSVLERRWDHHHRRYAKGSKSWRCVHALRGLGTQAPPATSQRDWTIGGPTLAHNAFVTLDEAARMATYRTDSQVLKRVAEMARAW